VSHADVTEELRRLLVRHVDAGTMPGAVATIGADLAPVVVGVAGLDGTPLRADAIFRIQSMTKTITAVAALQLVEKGQIGLDDSVEPWLPELADRRVLRHPSADLDDTLPADRGITLRDLLTNQPGGERARGSWRAGVARRSGDASARAPAGPRLAIPPVVRHTRHPPRPHRGHTGAGTAENVCLRAGRHA
jgi:CubicO group peptidase (beta-lactamase class C family)